MTLNMALLTSLLHTHGDDDSCPGSHCCTRRTPPSWWSENLSSHLPWERSVPFGSLFWIPDRYDLSSFHLSFSQRTDHTGRLIQLKWDRLQHTGKKKKSQGIRSVRVFPCYLTFWQVILKQMRHALRSLLQHNILKPLEQAILLFSLFLSVPHLGSSCYIGKFFTYRHQWIMVS